MAISRSLMNRQLYANGSGIMKLSQEGIGGGDYKGIDMGSRTGFGILKKIGRGVRKLIPNEIADIAVKAAPFVAPFNPALAGAMAGIGSFDQTGSIGDSLKRGALTYGGGQAARYIGGAGFQGNPFASGGAFTPSGFTSGFTSPLGSETGLGKFFSNRGTQPVEGLTGSEVGGEITMADSAVTGVDGSPKILAEQMSEVSLTPQKLAEKVTEQAITGSPKQMTITESIQKILSPNSTLNERGSEALNLLKRGTKAAFTKTDAKGNTVIDKPAVMGALAFTASYAEARALAAETGIDEDLTEAEYDELTKADKKEEYASYLTNFFAGKKDGGRIGFAKGSPKEPSEIGIMTIDVEAGDDEDEYMEMAAGISFNSAEKSYLFRKLGGGGGASRSYTMPMLYKILNNPGAYPNDARVLKELTIGLGLGKKDGGRIGLESGTPQTGLAALAGNTPQGRSDTRETDMINMIYEQQGGDGLNAYLERNPDLKDKYVIVADGMSGELTIMPNMLHPDNIDMEKISIITDSTTEDRAQGGRIGYKGGANRVAELLILRDELVGKGEDVSDIEAELFQLTGKTFRSVGGIGDVPTGKMRKNNAGVIERDYRDEGGFVPVGIKERADDVPAMLSKNEFVMTADAVRGIGGGDVEKGSKRLYNTMKQAEKVGRA